MACRVSSPDLLYQPYGDPHDPEFIFKQWKLPTLSKRCIVDEIHTIMNWLSYLVLYIEANFSSEEYPEEKVRLSIRECSLHLDSVIEESLKPNYPDMQDEFQKLPSLLIAGN